MVPVVPAGATGQPGEEGLKGCRGMEPSQVGVHETGQGQSRVWRKRAEES